MNFNMMVFKERYASDAREDGNPLWNWEEFRENALEWQRFMQLQSGSKENISSMLPGGYQEERLMQTRRANVMWRL